MRLDYFLSKALQKSRTEVSNLISKGIIEVNNQKALRKNMQISDNDIVSIDGNIIEYKAFLYIMMNKPSGYVSATTDEKDKTIIDLLPYKRSLFPVGRLDKDTEGLLLIMNDGKLAHHLTSPRHHIQKKYYVVVDKELTNEEEMTFQSGIDICDGKQNIFHTKPSVLEKINKNTYYVSITEGKYHQIKRMFLYFDIHVTYLKRISMGPIILDESLQPGEYRFLSEQEIDLLKHI